ncbi:MAG: pilus assembly protein TadG-related protein [Terracidiphilus sp.]
MRMKVMKDESGQVLVLTALSMVILLGFMAFAIDVGLLFRAKRNMQIAADAAAIAGALDYKYNGSLTSAQAAAVAAASANGVTSTGTCPISGSTQTFVCINIPPVYGPNAGSSGFVEALISQPNQTVFMGIIRHSGLMAVGARAVAGSGASSGCIWALAKSGLDVSLTGSGAITAQNCSIFDNSSASDALTLTGSGSISAKAIGIVGNYNKTGSGTITPNPPTTGISPAADPLASLSAPTVTTGTCTGTAAACNPSNTGSGNLVVPAGTYTSISNTGSGTLTISGGTVISGNLTNTGSGALVLDAGNYSIGGNFSSTGSSSLTLGAGLYTIGGNLALTGSGSLTGVGVSFYTQGSTTVTGSGSMDLTAPTSGPDNGILIFQSRTDSSAVSITGSGGDVMQGIVYASDSPLTLTGSGSFSASLDVIVDSLSVTGSGSITDTNYAVVTNTNSPLGKLVMVE